MPGVNSQNRMPPYPSNSPTQQPQFISQLLSSSPGRSSHARPILNHDSYQQSPPSLALPSGAGRSPQQRQQQLSPLNAAFPSLNGGRGPVNELGSHFSSSGTSPFLQRSNHSFVPLKPAPAQSTSARNYHDSPPTHSHPSFRRNSLTHSPDPSSRASPTLRYEYNNNNTTYQPKPIKLTENSVPEKPPRSKNPMSISNVLSNPTESPESSPKPKPMPKPAPKPMPKPAAKPVPKSTPKATPKSVAKAATKSAAKSTPRATPRSTPRSSAKSTSRSAKKAAEATKAVEAAVAETPTPKTARPESSASMLSDIKVEKNTTSARETKKTASSKSRKALTQREHKKIEKAMAQIDAMSISDADTAEFEVERQKYEEKMRKREREICEEECGKRKRRRIAFISHFSEDLKKVSSDLRFKQSHEHSALEEVERKIQAENNERKKDMQRKRRREATIQKESQKAEEARQKAKEAEDKAEHDKYIREAEKAEKKAKNTQRILERGNAPEEIREVTPLAPNLEGGTMSSFHMDGHATPEPSTRRKSGRTTNGRLKKSKEKKQSEKDRAAAAYAAMQRAGEEPLVPIAPKEDVPKINVEKEPKETKEPKEVVVEKPSATPTPTPTQSLVNYTSKGYNQIYDQIWRDLARKDIPKVYRIKESSLATKQSNLRKTAQLSSKEARRWQLRTNKSTKDVQARAKRTMRVMMSFWKRNEREERDLRRMAERQELEMAKRAEADREANRQKRKLNFLISQTELYSHFIGRKIKTDEVERSTDLNVDVSQQMMSDVKPDAQMLALSSSGTLDSSKITNFDDLDFDLEDETTLKEAAVANAQHAVQQAQDRARAFNGDAADQMARFDEGEMNFQNPSSLGDMEIPQPKMLTAQLKEYQLKGLNWLVNLYEQGINGILADEMGLGKTVQSISVMAYLAEKHNIWGPFLVIAPSSTLHNWQQEVTKFVPDLKVLPYWGTAKDRKVLRKFWDRKHITYTKESPFHVLVTSYQLVVQDTQYFQKIKWQYMILDEAQAIKSSQSSRWKNLLGFHCRNRLLLTGTPIQNNMQELWALLHFIMPTLFDSHDEFSDWFSKDIESHAQSNTKLNEDQLKRLHMILKPFMLRRIKKHVQKELGDKVEMDVFCDLTYRQRSYYTSLRNRISIMDLIEKAAVGDQEDTATLMNLVMQFRKVCNHPDLFERAETTSPFSLSYFAETASFIREGHDVTVGYSIRNLIGYDLPRMLCGPEGRINMAGPGNEVAGFRSRYLYRLMNIWTPENIQESLKEQEAFSWLRFVDVSPSEVHDISQQDLFQRAIRLPKESKLARFNVLYNGEDGDAAYTPKCALFNIVERNDLRPLNRTTREQCMVDLYEVSTKLFDNSALSRLEQAARPGAIAPPIEIISSEQNSLTEIQQTYFNASMRRALFGVSEVEEEGMLQDKIDPGLLPVTNLLPEPISEKARYTHISVPSMRRFVTDSGKLAKLDQLLRELKSNGHRVLLYFQMTRMIDLMEEYLTYRNYKYLRLDGSTKLEDRRDTVHDFQTRPEIFIFLLSTRAGGLGINLTSADTVIFYDSDWNPTIDSQAMDRAHRLGQTKQVTVYRLITRGTIEERIRKRALQKEEVQRVVISGGAGAHVDFNTRSRENRTKDIAMWLADDEQAELIERKEKELAQNAELDKDMRRGGRRSGMNKKRTRGLSLDEMYHEGEGNFDDGSGRNSGMVTPLSTDQVIAPRGKGRAGARKGTSKRAKTTTERLRMADGEMDM